MVKVGKLFAGDFMRGIELGGEKCRVLIISSGEIMQSGKWKDYRGKLKEQVVLPVRFKETIRKLGLNKTSVKRISLEYSEDTEKWVGKHLDLVPQTRIINNEEVIVIMSYPVKEESLRETLFSTIKKKKPDEDFVEETQEEKDNWGRI